jgi:hypothetical protein
MILIEADYSARSADQQLKNQAHFYTSDFSEIARIHSC